jgi:DNA-binding MarR family transcriptional regulator
MDRAVSVAAAGGIVADVLELQPISLVRLLDRLVEHGLLERRPDPNDRRANRLFLTVGGRQLVDDLDSLHDAIATDVLQDIPDTAIETSLETLRDVKERIKGFAEPPGRKSRFMGISSLQFRTLQI